MSSSLGFIGCGKMAYAILKGISGKTGLDFDFLAVNDIDGERARTFQREFGAYPLPAEELLETCQTIILVVKPQQVKSVLNAGRWQESKLLISVAAGLKTTVLELETGVSMPVVRVMPNTPALIGQGVSALCRGRFASNEDMALAESIFGQVGACVRVEEKYMDAVTAMSGSGPAYVFLVIEAMINAGIQIGLDAALARRLAVNTLAGSAALLESSGEHPAVLREQVCSPGGTTIAGVRQLEENGLRQAFFRAIESAWQRSIELGQD